MTSASSAFARASMGPWGGFVTGLCENVEYVLTPAVIVSFLATYLAAVFETPPAWLPAYWLAGYAVFVALNVRGVELSFKVTVVVTLASLACLAVFWISALPVAEFGRYALNIGAGSDGKPVELAQGGGPLLPFGLHGALAALPFAVWLFLAIEQLPLAAEESVEPSRDIPRGIVAGLLTLFVSAGLIVWLNPSVAPGSFQLASSGEPLLDGFRATFGGGWAKILALVACIGLIASFHTILFAKGRQIYSLSRAGYFPRFLSITHPRHKTPYIALIAGSAVALGLQVKQQDPPRLDALDVDQARTDQLTTKHALPRRRLRRVRRPLLDHRNSTALHITTHQHRDAATGNAKLHIGARRRGARHLLHDGSSEITLEFLRQQRGFDGAQRHDSLRFLLGQRHQRVQRERIWRLEL